MHYAKYCNQCHQFYQPCSTLNPKPSQCHQHQMQIEQYCHSLLIKKQFGTFYIYNVATNTYKHNDFSSNSTTQLFHYTNVRMQNIPTFVSTIGMGFFQILFIHRVHTCVNSFTRSVILLGKSDIMYHINGKNRYTIQCRFFSSQRPLFNLGHFSSDNLVVRSKGGLGAFLGKRPVIFLFLSCTPTKGISKQGPPTLLPNSTLTSLSIDQYIGPLHTRD